MTVEVLNTVAGPFTPNGVTTTFSFDFKIDSTTGLSAYFITSAGVLTTVSTARYSVTLDADGEGGSLIFGTPPIASEGVLYIEGNPSFQQEASFSNAGFLPAALNPVIDQAAMRALFLKNRLARTLQFSPGETPDPLPPPAARSNMILGFAADGARVLKSFADWMAGVAITITTAAGFSVPTRGLLQGILSPSDGQTAFLSERGKEGDWRFSSANHKTDCDNDPGGIVWLARTGGDGTTGAWERIFKEFLSVRWADAKGDNATDDTTAITRVIAYACYIGGGKIYFPDGQYLVTQLTVPANASVTTGFVSLEFFGARMPNTFFGTLPFVGAAMSHKGAILRTAASNITGSILNVAASGGFAGFSNYVITVHDLTFRSYDVPNVNLLDLSNAQQNNVYRCAFDTGVYPPDANNPVNDVAALITARDDNGAINRVDDITVTGYATAVRVGEHFHGSGMQFICCVNGLWFNGARHASEIGRVGAYRCQRPVVFNNDAPGYHYFKIRLLDIEHSLAVGDPGVTAQNSWQITVEDVRDFANAGRGTIVYHVVKGGVGPVADFTKTHGTGIVCTRLGDPPPPKLAVFYDNNGTVPVATGGIGTKTFIPFTLNAASEAMGINIVVDNTTINITEDGTYKIVFPGTFAGNATGKRFLFILRNGAVIGQESCPAGDTDETSLTVFRQTGCLAGDTIRFAAAQTSGGSLNFLRNAYSGICYFEKVRESAL